MHVYKLGTLEEPGSGRDVMCVVIMRVGEFYVTCSCKYHVVSQVSTHGRLNITQDTCMCGCLPMI